MPKPSKEEMRREMNVICTWYGKTETGSGYINLSVSSGEMMEPPFTSFRCIWILTIGNSLRDSLLKTNKKLSILSTITRHDIRNQLTGLSVFLQLVKSEFPDDQILQNYISKMMACSENIERQIEFTRNYEDLGRANAGWFDVYQGILEEAQQLPLEGITLDSGKKGFSIYADPLIGKVYYNLIENSLRHGEHVTKIAFTMTETENGLMMTYTDNGVGIQPSGKREDLPSGLRS